MSGNEYLPDNPKSAAPSFASFNGGGVFGWAEGRPTSRESNAIMTKEHVMMLHHAAMAAPYHGEWNADTQSHELEDPMLEGLTLGEAMIYKRALAAARGDKQSYDAMMDRTMGKPMQSVQSVTANVSYSEMLDILAEKDQTEVFDDEEIIDITPVTVDPIFDDEDDLLGGL